MADSVTTNKIYSSDKWEEWEFLNLSDGTGETDVVKVDMSTLTTYEGASVNMLSIYEIMWNVKGFNSVKVSFDGAPSDDALMLSGEGYRNYYSKGGYVDPTSGSPTGDILFTTNGGTAGSVYNVTMRLKKK